MFKASELAEYMGATEEEQMRAAQREQRALQAREGKAPGRVGAAVTKAAAATQDVLNRDVSAKFFAARQEESGRNKKEVETETVTTTKVRNTHSYGHNYDAGVQESDGPSFG